MTLRLSATTPAALTVNLSSGNTSVATVPSSVTIPASSDHATVQVTAVALGNAVIHANVTPNIPDAAANITVQSAGTINVPATTSVGLGQRGEFAVSLATAPASAVTVNLSSSDTSKVTVSPATVTIAAGATAPTTQPQVTGANIGSANITASASGYTSGTGAVNVTASLSFNPSSITVGAGASQNVTLSLSHSTPTAVAVTLTSDAPAVATVPVSVTIPANGTSVTVPVTGVANGSTTIHATGPAGVSAATASVSVASDIIMPATLSVGPGQQAFLSLSLAHAATQAVFIGLTTSNPAKVTLQQSTVVIQAGQTQPASPPRVNGIDFGTSTITASASGLAPASTTVSVGATLSFSLSSLTVAPSGNQAVGINLSATAPSALTVNLSSSDTAVATVPASVIIPAGQSGVAIQVHGVALGSATITASTAVSTITSATLPVTVATPGSIVLPASFVEGIGASVAYPVNLSSPAGASGVTVTLTENSPIASFVPLSCPSTPCAPVPAGATQTTVFIAAGQTAPSSQPQLRGVTPGSATVTASATGYASVTKPIQVTASFSFSPQDLTINGQQVRNILLTLSGPAPPPPIGLTVTLTSSNPGVASVQSTVTAFWDGSTPTTLNIPVTGIASGTTVIRASAPSMADATANITVTGPLSITTTTLPSGVANVAYSASVAAGGGTQPYSWSATGLPAGLSINPSTGAITGTPTAATTSTAAITVTDSSTPSHQTVTKNLSITIGAALMITTATLPGGAVNSAYNTTLQATGGTQPYSWSASGLPAGLQINASTGVISGTPTAAGMSTVALTVTDSTTPNHVSATTNLSISIAGPLTISTASLPDGLVNSAYSVTLGAGGGTSPYTWAMTGLPAGLTFSASSGTISGTPTAAGTSTVAITVTDSTNPTHQTASVNLSLRIGAGLTITTATLPGGTANAQYSATLAASGGTQPFTWASTGLPAGLSLNASTGAITGTPTAAGTSSVAVTVTDSTSPTHQTATANFSIVIGPPLTITTSSLPAGAVTAPYSITLAVSGGQGPYTWGATGLPPGLSLNPANGVISGTPTSAVTNTVVITVTDSTLPTHLTATKSLSISIAGALNISTTSLPDAIQNASYSVTLQAGGGTMPYTWAASGLPAGLSINTSTGVIGGAPSAAGTSSVNITLTDATLPTHLTATANLSLTVRAPLTITTSALAAGAVSTAYTASLAAANGTPPFTWSVTSGMPAGLSINPSTGVISGTPSASGTSTLAVRVTDATAPTAQVSTRNLSLTIAPALTITTATLPDGTVGTAYSTTLSAGGGNQPYSWAATGLPAGLSINAASGAITGTPSADGTSTVAVTVTDSTGTTHAVATKNLSLSVAAALSITTATLPTGAVNSAYSAALSVSGGSGPYTWSATGLPAGLGISTSTGVISGTPSASGTSSVVVTVTDSAMRTGTRTLSLQIVPALSITTTTLPAGSVHASYSATVAATGGTQPFSWSATGLPAGLTIDSGTGVISGTPTAAGTSTVTVTVTDSTSPTHLTANKGLSLTINPPVPASMTATAGSGQSTIVSTQFGGQLQVSVRDAGNSPVSGAVVTFTAPGSGPSLTFSTGGTVANVATNAAGLATAPVMTANGITGSYNVVATLASVSPVNFGLSNMPVPTQGQIGVSNANVGKDLQSSVTITLPVPAGPSGVEVTVSTADQTRVGIGNNAAGSVKVTITEGNTQAAVVVQGLANSGTVVLTATANGFTDGTGTATLTPSGFVLAGPNDIGGSFQTFTNVITTMTVFSARLTSTGAYAEKQTFRASYPTSVTVPLSSSPIGTISSSVVFNAGDGSLTASFNSGLTAGSATISAAMPAGFTALTDGKNTVGATVLASALVVPSSITVGRNLQASAAISLNGVVPPAGTTLVLTSSDVNKLRFSTTATGAGSGSISIPLPGGAHGSPDFYVQALASSGTVGYTAQASGFGSAAGTVTLAPSGIVFTNSFGGVPNPLLVAVGGSSATVTVRSAILDGSGNWVQTQPVAGGNSVTVTVSSGNSAVGTVTPSQVTIPGGSESGTTQFQPAGAGTTSINVSVPSSPVGFSTPSSTYAALPVTATVSRIVLTADGIDIGKDLQVQGSIVLNQAAPTGGLPVTLSNSTGQLLFAANPTSAGQATLQITVPAGSNTAAYYVQATGNSGTPTYTATASGYAPGSAIVARTPSGVVLSSNFDLPFTSLVVGATVSAKVSMAQLDPGTNGYVSSQALRGGLSLNVTINTDNAGVTTVDSPVTINGGAEPGTATTTVHGIGTGQTLIRVVQPSGFVAGTNVLFDFKPMPTLQVTVNPAP